MALFAASLGVIALGIWLYVERQPAPKREITGNDGAPMVLITGGSFTMGSNDWEEDEKPPHTVYLRSFYLDKYEVTTAQYAKFLAATGWAKPFKWDEANLAADGDRPVIGVSWDDAADYCRWAGQRLPTEAEWEKAARGVDGRIYPWGNEEPSPDRGNFDKGTHWEGYATLSKVGSFESGKSPFGVYDMSGNVSEWTNDWYDPNYYRKSPPLDPKGPDAADVADVEARKVIRGAAWTSGPDAMRVTFRAASAPTNQHGNVGFRCAQDVEASR